MMHNYSSKTFLAFIISLMPLSTYSVSYHEFNELTLYKNHLTVLKNASHSAYYAGMTALGATFVINFFICLCNSTKSKKEEETGYISLLSNVLAVMIVYGLYGLSNGYEEVLKQIDL